MTKLEDLMNKYFFTVGLTVDQQIEINNGLSKNDSNKEYEKFFRWLNAQL